MLDYTFGQFDDNQCIKKFSHGKQILIMIYYSFTTFSTVGLGDYHPRSNFERLLIAPGMFFGVMCVAYLSNEFVAIS